MTKLFWLLVVAPLALSGCPAPTGPAAATDCPTCGDGITIKAPAGTRGNISVSWGDEAAGVGGGGGGGNHKPPTCPFVSPTPNPGGNVPGGGNGGGNGNGGGSGGGSSPTPAPTATPSPAAPSCP